MGNESFLAPADADGDADASGGHDVMPTTPAATD